MKEFSITAGNLDDLYSSILLRLNGEERKWAREILRWLTLSKKDFTVAELPGAAEVSMEDQLDDFEDFLEVQCGSFLRIVTSTR
jgi:hypothetical protein